MNQSPWAPPYGKEPARSQTFNLKTVILTWTASYFVALFVSSAILVATGNTDIVSGQEPKWFLGVSALALWVPFIIGLYLVSQKLGSQRFSSDFFLKFRRVDLWGLPIGIAGQLVLVGLVTWPFRVLFPEKFAPELIEKRAQDLFNNATGPWLIVLILVVVIGAPFVEELVYRGFIQSGLKNRLGSSVAVVITAVWFAAVHLQLVEFPGLLAFALVLGFCFHRTHRIGMSIVAHVAFNATGLLLVALL
jgi:membrane protease YdiL (CAAX protease family)